MYQHTKHNEKHENYSKAPFRYASLIFESKQDYEIKSVTECQR